MNKKLGLPKWIIIWLIISTAVVFWDVMFVLLRPASFIGGNLGFLWVPYAKYIKIDTSYADLTNTFVIAQSIMSLFEIAISIIALFLNYFRQFNQACLLAYSALLLTCAKTILIFVIEMVSGLKHVGHNTSFDLIMYYILPNAIWIIIPAAAILTLGRLLTLRIFQNNH